MAETEVRSINGREISDNYSRNQLLNKMDKSKLNDNIVVTDGLWSSDKINNTFNNLNENKIDKSKINDDGNGTDELWSASKVNAQFNTIENQAYITEKAKESDLKDLEYKVTSKKYGKISLPSDFNSKGIELVRSVDSKIYHNIDIDFKNKIYDKVIYFDTNNGNDSTGNGLESQPYKTLSKCFSIVELSSSTTFKIIGKGKIFRDECYNEGTVNWIPTFTDKTIYLVGNNGNLVISNGQSSTRVGGYGQVNNPLVWSNYNQIWKTSRAKTTNVIDLKNKDFYGFGIPLKNVNTLSACESEHNTYYIEEPYVYVNTYNSRQPDDDLLVCPCTPLFYVKLSNSKLIIENVDFYGGVNMTHDGICYIEGDKNSAFIGINCKASGGNLTNTTSGSEYANTTNGFALRDLGLSMMFNCGIAYTRRDGFNYHYYNVLNTRECLAFEYDCYGHQTGYKDTNTSNQYSTVHDGVNCIRVNCVGHDTGGTGCEDVDDSYSILIDCHMAGSKIKDGSSYGAGYRFHGVSGEGKSLLIGCSSNDNAWDITGSTNFPVEIQQGFIGSGKTKDITISQI